MVFTAVPAHQRTVPRRPAPLALGSCPPHGDTYQRVCGQTTFIVCGTCDLVLGGVNR